jgi:hypothetical protein
LKRKNDHDQIYGVFTSSSRRSGRLDPMTPNSSHDRADAVQHKEGPVAKAIEDQTAKLPSDWFLWAAGSAAAASLALQLCGRQKTSNFVAQWAPTILICGLYNKLVKVHGHDRASQIDNSPAINDRKKDNSHPEAVRPAARVIPAGGAPASV